jgi:hypothetical protein
MFFKALPSPMRSPLAATLFGHSVQVRTGQSAEVLSWLDKYFAGQNAGPVFIQRPHKKSVKKIWMDRR